jgi:CDP-diacylglycerol--glycerol-3-phosphate 3-phosphatidyltransferase
MNPHYLTFIRIFISPLFLLAYMYHQELGLTPSSLPAVLIFLLGISELSDALDGYLARKYNQVTDLGKILDPMADSIYRLSVFLTFTQKPVSLPIGLVFIFLYRDSVVSTLRTICALKGFALAARLSGKAKAVIQALAALCVLILMLFQAQGLISPSELTQFSTWIVGCAAAYTLYSGIDYIYSNWPYVKKTLSPKKKTETTSKMGNW